MAVTAMTNGKYAAVKFCNYTMKSDCVRIHTVFFAFTNYQAIR